MRTDYYTPAPAGGGPGRTGTPRYTVIPFEAPPQPEEKKRRGSRKAPWIFAIFLVLIVALTTLTLALSWMMGQNGRSENTAGNTGGGNYNLIPIPSASDPAVTDLKRAPTGTGVTLAVAGPSDEVLTYQEIYDRNIAAVVSIRAYQTGGGSTGTGVVMTADGYIITNYHVIQGSYQVEVVLADDSVHQALLVGGDQTNDLAVLKIDAAGLTPAQFGDSDLLRVGDPALAIGNPLGEELRGTMTDGIISAINRDVNVDGYTMSLLQTTAALNNGNSGGALINRYGQVVGITNLKMQAYDGTVEGLGFAIPTATVKTVVDALIAHGQVENRPTIGITGYTVTEEMAESWDCPRGVLVQTVREGSDAQMQGILPGDIITEANGTAIATMEELQALRDGLSVGDTLALRLWRSGHWLERTVALVDQYTLDG